MSNIFANYFQEDEEEKSPSQKAAQGIQEQIKEKDNIFTTYFEEDKKRNIQTPSRSAPTPVEEKKPSIVHRAIGKAKDLISGVFKKKEEEVKTDKSPVVDAANTTLAKVLEDKYNKLRAEQQLAKPNNKRINDLSTDIKEIEDTLVYPSSSKDATMLKWKTAQKYSTERTLDVAKSTLTGLAKSMLDGVAQVFEVDFSRRLGEAEDAEKTITEGFQKLNVPESERQALLEKYSPRYKKDPLKPNVSSVAEQQKAAKKAIDEGRVPFQKVMEKYIEDTAPTNPEFTDQVIGGVSSMAGFYAVAVATGGGSLLPTLLESLGESGSVYDQNKKNGMSATEAFSNSSKTFIGNVIWNYALNRYSQIFEDIGEPALKGLKNKVMAAVKSASGEGIQEAGQQLLSNATTNADDAWEGVFESFGLGALIGAGAKGLEVSSKDSNQLPKEEVTSIVDQKEEKPPLEIKKESVDNVLERVMNSSQSKGRLSEATVENLKQTQIGVNELNFDENGNITLYKKGEIVEGQPTGFSVKQLVDQKPFVINKADILANVQSAEFLDFVANNYKEDGGQYDRKNMLDMLENFKEIESEVVVLPRSTQKQVEVTPAKVVKETGQPVKISKIIEDKAPVVTKTQERSIKVPKANAPVGTGETKTSRFAERVAQQLGEAEVGLPTYNQVNLEKDAKNAVNLLEKDPEKAVAVSLGLIETPKGQTTTGVAVATALKAKDEGNYGLYTEIMNSTSLRLTRAGQEIVAVRGNFNDDTPENYVRRIIQNRMEELGNRLISNAEKAGKLLGKTPNYKKAVTERIDKETAKLKEKISKDQVKLRMAQDIIDAMRC